MNALLRGSLMLGLASCASTQAPRPAPPLPPLSREVYASYLAGKLAQEYGNDAEAVRRLSAAAAAAPDQPNLAVALSRAQLAAQDLAGATNTATAAAKQWPRNGSVWRAVGDIAQARGDTATAIRAFERAIELISDSEAAYLSLATMFVEIEKPDQARATLKRLLAKVPSSVEANWRLASDARTHKLTREAEQYFRAVLELEPDHLSARLELAAVRRERGDMAGALTQARQAFDRSGQDADVGEALFWLLCEDGDRLGALDVLALLDDDQASAAAALRLAELYLTVGELSASEHAANEAAAAARARSDSDAADDLALAEVAAARARRAAGDRAGAKRRFAKVSHSAATVALAEMALEDGDVTAALALLDPAVAADPNNLELLLAQALARHARGDGDASAKQLRDYVAAAPASERGATAIALADYYEHIGDVAAAIVVLRGVVREVPDPDAILANQLGYLLTQSGESLAEAEVLLRLSRRQSPGDPAVLDSWGWLRLKQGHVALALRALGRAAALAPHRPEILEHQAEALVQAGERERARRVLAKALTLAPPGALHQRIKERHSALSRAQ